jgi:hypothetical protein
VSVMSPTWSGHYTHQRVPFVAGNTVMKDETETSGTKPIPSFGIQSL